VMRRSARGFSLIELLIVLAIGLVLTSMAIPMTISAMRTYQLNSAVSAVTGAIQSTRYAAIMHGSSYQVAFADNIYQVLTVLPTPPWAAPGTTYLSPVGGSIPITSSGGIFMTRVAIYQFAPGGTVTDVSPVTTSPFSIKNTWGGSYTITVSGVGNVTVTQP